MKEASKARVLKAGISLDELEFKMELMFIKVIPKMIIARADTAYMCIDVASYLALESCDT